MERRILALIPLNFEGRKDDQGKARYDLIPECFEEQLAQVLTFGAEKYAAHNYLQIENAPPRYYAACRRHLNAMRRGEWQDEETGLPHVIHAACSLLMLHHWCEHHGETWAGDQPMDGQPESQDEESGEDRSEPDTTGAAAAEAGLFSVRDFLRGTRVPGLGGLD